MLFNDYILLRTLIIWVIIGEDGKRWISLLLPEDDYKKVNIGEATRRTIIRR